MDFQNIIFFTKIPDSAFTTKISTPYRKNSHKYKKKKKMENLKQLKPYLEEKYMDFYNTIYEWLTSEKEDKDEDEIF